MIREIAQADIPVLFDIRPKTRENAMSLEELASIGITEQSISAAIRGTHKGWLFEESGVVAGFAMGDSENSELTVMAILPAYENRGIGRQLMTHVETWLKSEGCEKIWLTTDTDPGLRAYGFYRRLGWEDWKIERGLRYMTKALEDART